LRGNSSEVNMSDRGRFSILKQSDFVSIMEDQTRGDNSIPYWIDDETRSGERRTAG
jgi:hypothetical protein